MSIVDNIQSLNMEVDSKFYQKPLVEALDLYHNLINENIIKPRENQLIRNETIQPNIHFNVTKK